MNKEELLTKANKYAKLFKAYRYVLNVFQFDHTTIAPINSMDEGNEASSILSNEFYKITKSEDYLDLVKRIYEKRDEFDEKYKRLFALKYLDLEKEKNISPEFQYEMSLAANNAYTKWVEAKEKADFSIFEPYLEKNVELTRKMISLRDKKFLTPYDTLLDDYEPGGNEKNLDYFFNSIKIKIIELLNKIKKSDVKIRTDFLSYKVAITKQEKISNYLLNYNKFDMKSGVLSTTEHPFTTFPSHHDVRVTTHYYEDLFLSNIYSVIHEGGHGIFAQNEPDDFYEIGLAGNMTSGQHECMSRFYENLIGRNKNYLHNIFKEIKKVCKKEFENVSEEDLYLAVNVVKPSLIRTESDELTYCLHIIIRYEIERDLINGVISTKNLNQVWNQKYKEYLGLTPPSDREGILQDVHWSNASFGYFPSYALGNAYSAQILNTMKKEIDFDNIIANGDMDQIKTWLKNKTFNIASLMDPEAWIQQITGEKLNPKYFLDYLENKYKTIYKF